MSITTARGSLAAVPTAEDVLRATQDAIEQLDAIRASLAALYARLPTEDGARGTSVHPEAEFEVGESIQALRNAFHRLRKARGVLAQDALPFTRPERR